MTNGRTRMAVVAVVVVALATTAVGAAGYGVTTSESVSVPERTVEQGGDTFTIASIGRADPGDSVDVRVTAPDDESVSVYLYNADRQIVAARDGTGSGTFSIDLEGYDAGTYTFVLQHDGVREAAHPLVVRGYAVDVTAPGSVTEGESLHVTVDATKLRGDDLDAVEVVVANADTTVRRDASRADDGTYTATVDTDGLDPGSYQVYANVRGPDTAQGEDEILGLADPVGTDVDPDADDGGGGGVPSTTTATSTPADGTPTGTEGTDTTEPTEGTDTTEATTETGTSTPAPTGTSTDEDAVVTPSDGGTATDTATTTGAAPTHVPVILGVAAVVVALFARLRRR